MLLRRDGGSLRLTPPFNEYIVSYIQVANGSSARRFGNSGVISLFYDLEMVLVVFYDKVGFTF
jgi:hypothetical protein